MSCDSFIRGVMAATGFYSGFTVSNSTVIRTGSFIWHGVIAVTLPIIFIFLSATSRTGEEDLFELIFKILQFTWMLTGIIYSWNLLYHCHSPVGVKRYYKQLDETLASLQKLSINRKELMLPWRQKLFAITILVIGFVNILYVGVETSILGINPVIGNSLHNRNLSSELTSAIQVNYFIITCFGSFIFPGTAIYIMNVAYVIRYLFEKYNQRLKAVITDSIPETLDKLEGFRKVHLTLCSLLSVADDCFHQIVGVIVTSCMVILLMLLYLLAEAIKMRVTSALFYGISALWTGLTGVILFLLVYFCHKAYEEVGKYNTR